jgi:hypothetical protein
MNDLGKRLRSADPLRTLRPLDDRESGALRRAIVSAVPAPRRSRAPLLLGGLGLAAAVLGIALFLPPRQEPARPVAALRTSAPSPAPSQAPLEAGSEVAVTVPAPPPRRRAVPRPRSAEPAGAAEPADAPAAQAKELRFVTANGTQIVWTFRSAQEGA